MISKKDFISFINKLKEYQDIEENLSKISQGAIQLFEIDSLSNMITLFVQILEKEFNSKDDWIDYYIWELDFGKDYKPGIIKDKSGKDIQLKTPEDLYNLLIDIYNSNKENVV